MARSRHPSAPRWRSQAVIESPDRALSSCMVAVWLLPRYCDLCSVVGTVIGPRWGSSSVFWGTQGHLGVCRCTLNVLSTMLNAPRNTLQQELILTPSISASLGGMRRRPLIQLIVATQTVVAARPLLHRRIERCARMHLRRIIQLAEVSLERASGQPPVQPVGAAASSFDHPALRAAHCEARHWLGNR